LFNKPTPAVYVFDVCGLEINDIDICGNRQKALPDLQKKILLFLRGCDDPGREGKASAKNREKGNCMAKHSIMRTNVEAPD
jgi:hypothetical protein